MQPCRRVCKHVTAHPMEAHSKEPRSRCAATCNHLADSEQSEEQCQRLKTHHPHRRLLATLRLQGMGQLISVTRKSWQLQTTGHAYHTWAHSWGVINAARTVQHRPDHGNAHAHAVATHLLWGPCGEEGPRPRPDPDCVPLGVVAPLHMEYNILHKLDDTTQTLYRHYHLVRAPGGSESRQSWARSFRFLE